MPHLFDNTICETLADEVLARMGEEARAELRQMAREELMQTHFGLGLWIRNTWFYGADTTWISACPDDDSIRVIEAIWRRLQAE